MSRSRLVGILLCLLSIGGTVLFLWGLATQAYWAIAIPIGAFVVVVMTLLFWVGWTFVMTDTGPAERLPVRPTRPPQRPRQPDPRDR